MLCRRYSGWISRAIAVAACLAVVAGGAAGGQWEPLHKLIADDAAQGDEFGRSVSISGDAIVVGAYCDNDAGNDSGSAYLFDATTGEQLHKLTADDGAAYDWFGASVSVSGATIVVGAPWDDDHTNIDSGSAYVFDATTGEQLHKLTADDAEEYDEFGCSVSVSGNTVVVGAHSDYEEGSHSGSAYVFDAITGQQLHKLTADDPAAGRFGASVFVSGNTIIVGAPYDNHAGVRSGSAFIFDVATGEQLHKLIADDAVEQASFGCSVSISGNTIVVGAREDNNPGVDSGAAYVFDVTTGEQLYKLIPDDAETGDHFGHSVSISGDTIVVGAPSAYEEGSVSGSAYVFDAITGQQVHELVPDDAETGDHFGHSVSISANAIVVGARNDDDGGVDSGSAYVFVWPPCPADFDGDGDVDTTDLLHLLASWGTPEGDVDGDGDTDTADLLALLAAWGECPGLPCPWDFNGDGVVDDLDADILVEHWGACPDPPEECPWDLNGDGVVDIYDMAELYDNYGSCPQAPGPEDAGASRRAPSNDCRRSKGVSSAADSVHRQGG